MTYEQKKKFVLSCLKDGLYHFGEDIIDTSRGLLTRKTAFQTFERMVGEKLIHVRGMGRTWEREYKRAKPWERK